MHRIDTPGNAGGRFDDGDELAGREGTVLDADWLNAVQEEISNAIEGLDGELEKGSNSLLLGVIRALRDNIINEVVPEAILAARQAENPVGCTRIFANDSRNPSTILGFGSWVATARGRALVGVGSNGQSLYSEGQRFGTERVTLFESQMPRHRHLNGIGDDGDTDVYIYGTSSQDTPGSAREEVSGSTRGVTQQGYTSYEGSGNSHENRQPSEVFYVWTRIA